jgi:hypothetical protein
MKSAPAFFGNRRLRRSTIALAAIIAGMAVSTLLVITACLRQMDHTSELATPWGSIGGCGAGGSGGSSGATAKWIGKGISGGLLDVQVMLSSTATKKSDVRGLETRVSFKPTYTSVLALTVPVLAKTGSMQTSTADPELPGLINNGLGDLRLDYIKTFGLEGQFNADFTLSLPTGDYTATTGTDYHKLYLPTNLQLGSGLCNLSLDLGYTHDVQNGMWLFDVAYSYPFAANFRGNNRYFSFPANQLALLNDEQRRRFEYHFKPYGENDLGAYTPPSVMLSAFYGYKGLENYVHSFGAMFSAPLGVAWIPDFNTQSYNPKPDPDHQAWNLTLCYGLEFKVFEFPLFVAAYVPIHDKTASATNAQLDDPYSTEPMATWNGPDLHDVLHRWSAFIGVKSTLF